MARPLIRTPDAAVAEIEPGASLAIGGFGTAGLPARLIDALWVRETTDLHVISNNMSMDGSGIGRLASAGRVRKFTGSFPGATGPFLTEFRAGRIELELVPQGTLAERLRAGGAGIPAFYTPTGVGTLLVDGGMPIRYTDGTVATWSEARATADFDGLTCVLERAIRPDFALVHAHMADPDGNLRFRLSARNFNPVCAMAARRVIVEVEHMVGVGELGADDIHLPGAWVDVLVPLDETDGLVPPADETGGLVAPGGGAGEETDGLVAPADETGGLVHPRGGAGEETGGLVAPGDGAGAP